MIKTITNVTVISFMMVATTRCRAIRTEAVYSHQRTTSPSASRSTHKVELTRKHIDLICLLNQPYCMSGGATKSIFETRLQNNVLCNNEITFINSTSASSANTTPFMWYVVMSCLAGRPQLPSLGRLLTILAVFSRNMIKYLICNNVLLLVVYCSCLV